MICHVVVLLLAFPILSMGVPYGEILSVRQILDDSRNFTPSPVMVRAAYFSGVHGAYIQDLTDFSDSNRYEGEFEDEAVLSVRWPEMETEEDGKFRLDPSVREPARLLWDVKEVAKDSDDALVVATFEGIVQTKRRFRYVRYYWFFGEIIGGTGFGHRGWFKGELEMSGVRDIELVTLPIKLEEEGN